MFNSDLTKNFNYQDATMEILIMLAGSFLLGILFCWLLKKLTAKDVSNETPTINDAIDIQNTSNKQTAFDQPKVKAPENRVDQSYKTPRIDDLTKISGINSKMQDTLKNNGIRSYTDLRDIDHSQLKEILISSDKKMTNLREVETWPHQASLASKGEWTKLYDYQSFVQRAKQAAKNIKNPRPKDADDLKKIEGIGPKIEEILNKKGIYTFEQLRKTESDTLKRYIVIEDIRFEKNDTDSWPHQAGMAEKGQWEELSIYQEFMEADEDEPSNIENTKVSDNKSEKDKIDINHVLTEDDIEENTDVVSINNDYMKHLKKEEKDKQEKDDLKKIEGIGPKIEEVLNKNNIHTFKRLHKTDRNTLKEFLDKAGPQFKMHEPASWPHQAGMAARGEWNDLRTYQEFMDSGRETPSASASSEPDLSSLHIKTANHEDDLKKIEGIGPKIEGLLKDAGINTFEKLKNSNRNTLKDILNAGGPQYRMHEPETWPLQAGMAFKGDWEKLQEYQDFLMGGRE